jgi:hypothetical protein
MPAEPEPMTSRSKVFFEAEPSTGRARISFANLLIFGDKRHKSL